MNFFFNAQFNHFLLIWMLRSRGNSKKIKYFHKECRRFSRNEKQSTYKKFLLNDGAILHHRKIETPSIETYNLKNELSP